MSLLGGDLRTLLLGDAAIAALVGPRVYPQVLPQGGVYPAITYAQASDRSIYSLDGPSGLYRPRISVNCWSPNYAQAHALAALVRARLEGFRGTVGSTEIGAVSLDNAIDLFEQDAGASGIHRVMQDYFISTKEVA